MEDNNLGNSGGQNNIGNPEKHYSTGTREIKRIT